MRADLTDELIIPYIQGMSLNRVTLYLRTLCDVEDKHALAIFKARVSAEQKNRILTSLGVKIDLNRYNNWRDRLKLDDNLFHFLQYLSLQGFHRFRYLLKQINQIQAPLKYHRYCIAAMGIISLALAYFSQNQAAWIQFINWFKVSLPNLLMHLIDWMLIPENLSLFMIIYQTGKYLSECYLILSNHASTKEHKIQKLCHSTLNFLLISAAHSIIFLQLPVVYISGICFMLSSLVDLCWSLLLRHKMQKDQPLDYRNLEEISLSIPQKIQITEQAMFFRRKTKQMYIEGISLFITFVTSCISIYFAPSIACVAALCACFQFLVNITKNYYYNAIEREFAIQLQKTIEDFYSMPKASVSPPPLHSRTEDSIIFSL